MPTTTLTPWQRHDQSLKAVFDADKSLFGQVLIRGVGSENDDDDDDEEDEEEVDPNSLSQERVDRLRYILINKDREQCLEMARRILLGEQADDTICMFNTSFSYAVKDSFYSVAQKRHRGIRSKPKKFNFLFAYTYMLMEYDCWMHDNEGDMEDMVADLAKLWKKLLISSDADLGIDSEFTRPGVTALLEEFKEKIESSYSDPPFKFVFQ